MIKKYIDTNILIAYVVGKKLEKNQYPKAKIIFDQIKNGKFVGVISTLTLTEVIGVLRTRLGKNTEVLQKIEKQKQGIFVKTEASKLYSTLIEAMLQMPNIKFEKGRQINFQTVLDDSFNIMEEIVGVVKFYLPHKSGNSDVYNSSHKQILVADILHTLLAQDTQCDHFLTFDKGFYGVKNMDKLQSLIIDVC